MLGQRRGEFPTLPSATRFVELIPLMLRIPSQRVFAGLAQRGKGSRGWFYGFMLTWVINEQGELLGLPRTPGQVDDSRPVRNLVRQLWGKLFGDHGYSSQELFEQLWDQDLQLITERKRTMEKQTDAGAGQSMAAQTRLDGVCQRSAEKHQPDRAYSTPARNQWLLLAAMAV